MGNFISSLSSKEIANAVANIGKEYQLGKSITLGKNNTVPSYHLQPFISSSVARRKTVDKKE